MIFVDANVPMYLIGKAHPNKVRARVLLDQCVAGSERLVTDAEVLQEILHRYVAIDRRDAVQPAYDTLLAVVDHVFPVTREAVIRAHHLAVGIHRLSARDALHVAVMQAEGITRILTFDGDYDSIQGIERVR